MIEIYTDGGCDRKTGRGGYGVVILMAGMAPIEFSAAYFNTTTNRMEVMAVIAALKTLDQLKGGVRHIHVTSDSMYVVRGMNEFMVGWVRNNWRRWVNKEGQPGRMEPIKNADLWQQLHTLKEGRKVVAIHVRGHRGNRWNERCDSLATRARKYLNPIQDQGPRIVPVMTRCDF